MTRSVYFPLALLVCAALSGAEGTVSWQQVGGSLSISPTLKGIVGQGYLTPVQEGEATTLQPGFLAHPLLVNSAPFVVSNLPDLIQPAGFAPMLLDLGAVFADPDGALTYSVDAMDPSVAATVSGGVLVLTGIEGIAGTAPVVVSATDGSFSVSDTFMVTTQLSTGLATRAPATPSVQALAVGLPRIFASQVTGSGRGELGSASVQDEAHSLAVNLLLPAAGTISVKIFDQIGTPVISLSRTVSAQDLVGLEPNGDGRRVLPVTWNLRAANGAAVGAGVYLWKIELQTTDGQKLESVKRLGVKGTK